MGTVTQLAPYRMPAIIEAEPPPLAPHINRDEGRCPACRQAIDTRDPGRMSIQERFCHGGRYGFLWLRRCTETRPHMHQRCTLCGAKWITAPAMASGYEGGGR